jgi:hypothetical protein
MQSNNNSGAGMIPHDRFDFTGLPYVSYRNGMRSVCCSYMRNGVSVEGAIISNAYGNGSFTPRPYIISSDEYEKLKDLAKICELTYNSAKGK